MKKLSLLILVFVLGACSSKYKKDYEIVDASHDDIPEWIQDADEWAKDEEEDDYEKFKYYSFTTEPKNSKVTACEIAKLRANSEVASELSQFIKHSLSTTSAGDILDKDDKLEEYMDETLAKEVRSHVVGARTHKKYWEKRKFDKELGAKDNFAGYSCSVLVKISNDNMKKAYNIAFKKIKAKAMNKALRAKIEKVQGEIEKEFL
ncbi:MAG: hypothetical protein N4A33_12080 [Bacteriovoracaceae bacterium]|jgi:hypothetical protein|nr:hypothetical protein [Bacteriovoracaceae bacterium]